jgi:lipopolysaccharide-induced tumor necrosis factor-alpha factor
MSTNTSPRTLDSIGTEPMLLKCSSCSEEVTTIVQKELGTRNKVGAVVACMLCCWCDAMRLYSDTDLNNARHYCPKCKYQIAYYHHGSPGEEKESKRQLAQ